MSPKKKKTSTKKLPTGKQIDAGRYIDFEGFASNPYQKFPPPVLAGVLKDGYFTQHVFTETFRWAAEDTDLDYEVIYEPNRKDFLIDLVANTTSQVKPLFAYTDYEKIVIEHHVGHKITKRYRNVRAIAQRCFNQVKERPKFPESYALRDFAESLGLRLPAKLKKGGVTDRLREVRAYSVSRAKWASAPSSVRRAWRQVLEHNKTDVMILPDILKRMS